MRRVHLRGHANILKRVLVHSEVPSRVERNTTTAVTAEVTKALGDRLSARKRLEAWRRWTLDLAEITRFSGKTRKGNPFLRATLGDCAWGATRNNRAHFRRKYYRIKSRRGAKRAIVAGAHDLLRAAYLVLQSGQPYMEPAPRPMPERLRHRKAEQLARQLRKLGYEVTMRSSAA